MLKNPVACHTRTNLAVRVHTLPVCPNCSVLKKSLVEHGVSFKEHDLDSPQSHGQRVHRTTADNAPDLLFLRSRSRPLLSADSDVR